MFRNFFTINSKINFLKYTTILVGSVYIVPAIFYMVFQFWPEVFYFRAWEYFNEVVYNGKGGRGEWRGYEKGDKTRSYTFRFQDRRYTIVSTNNDGHRATPKIAGPYRMLVYGDSHCWGSRLSDDETFPWQLSKKLKTSVYNGGRDALIQDIITKSELKHVKLIINLIDAFHVSICSIFPEEINFSQEYIPIYLRWRQAVNKNRYIPFYRLLRGIVNISNDIESLVKPVNEYMINEPYHVAFTDDVLKESTDFNSVPGCIETNFWGQIERVTRYSEMLRKKGFTFILILIPRRDLLYAKTTDQYSHTYFTRLTAELNRRGVYAIDLTKPFLKNKDKGLHFKTDTHWTPVGVKIAVDESVKYIESYGLLPDGIAVTTGN